MASALFRSIILTLLLAVATGGAASAQENHRQESPNKTRRPPSEVDKVPGNYVQLDPIWVPTINKAGGYIQLGLVVRLWPSEGNRYHACIRVPWVVEALLMEFSRQPLRRDEYVDLKRLHERVSEAAVKAAGEGTYKRIDVMHETEVPDLDSAALTRTCT